MKNCSTNAKNSISFKISDLSINEETYFSQENVDHDLYDDEQDDFFYSQDMDEIEDNYDGFEFDNFD